MKYLMEIRPGEGGADAKLLVSDMANIYTRFAESLDATVTLETKGSL